MNLLRVHRSLVDNMKGVAEDKESVDKTEKEWAEKKENQQRLASNVRSQPQWGLTSIH